MEKKGKLLTAALLFFAIVPAAGCKKKTNDDVLKDVVYRENYDSVYDTIGKEVTVDMVREGADGKAYVTYDGKEYELGMDFLSMAMVYNTRPAGVFSTPTQVYNEWWRLFMQRWNMHAPEAPLYSNQYYDIYNAKISELKTSPYWGVPDAIVGAKILSWDNSVILGSNTELSGAFRNAAFGKSAAGAADLAVQGLTSGYATVNADMGGTYVDFLAYIPQGGRILDVGFGSGRDLAYFSKQGYLAHGIDLVEEFVLRARKEGLSAKLGNFHDLPFKEEFDGIWACASLLHSDNLPLAFENLSRALKVGGVFYLSMKYGKGKGMDGERFYQYVDEEMLISLAKNSGLTVEKITKTEDALGRSQVWLNVILHK
jgi:SAM-dependent methyltransferase